jgi:hypothetical protein
MWIPQAHGPAGKPRGTPGLARTVAVPHHTPSCHCRVGGDGIDKQQKKHGGHTGEYTRGAKLSIGRKQMAVFADVNMSSGSDSAI